MRDQVKDAGGDKGKGHESHGGDSAVKNVKGISFTHPTNYAILILKRSTFPAASTNEKRTPPMPLFTRIPQRFFTILTSAKKELYVEALFVLRQAFKTELVIRK